MRFNLGTKLFLAFLLVILVGIVVLVAVAQVSLPEAYGRHMAMMNGEGMMGNGRGPGGVGTGGAGYQNFRSGFFEALGWGGLAALAADYTTMGRRVQQMESDLTAYTAQLQKAARIDAIRDNPVRPVQICSDPGGSNPERDCRGLCRLDPCPLYFAPRETSSATRRW